MISSNSSLLVTTAQYCAYFTKYLYGVIILSAKANCNRVFQITKHDPEVFHHEQSY